MVVFGIIDFGRLLNAQIVVSQAAREGARAEAVGGNPVARATDAAGSLGPVAVGVGAACPANPGANAAASVTVTFTFQFITPVVALADLVAGPINVDARGSCRAADDPAAPARRRPGRPGRRCRAGGGAAQRQRPARHGGAHH
ncbi:hypothetical protein Prum_042670 [Phytohabitans rumicis]|uniref:TadE-like domain-containing protein n=2 Tax=Phytohabitans rumicis TaxID=1076125 RepID=A0A6V8LD78_9ACTN|nr:hypothetical protein Prum_042670 [Phytohabitans rumicis]